MSGHAIWLGAIAVLVLAIGVLVGGTMLVFRRRCPMCLRATAAIVAAGLLGDELAWAHGVLTDAGTPAQQASDSWLLQQIGLQQVAFYSSVAAVIVFVLLIVVMFGRQFRMLLLRFLPRSARRNLRRLVVVHDWHAVIYPAKETPK